MRLRGIAVIDIGKTNAKLALVDLANLEEIEVVTRPNPALPGPPWPHFDVEALWDFLLQALEAFQLKYGVDAITVTTHGACAALLAKDGRLAAPILDYEHGGPNSLSSEYDSLRPPFSETGSPRLAGGLNIGAQLHWQFAHDPSLWDRTWKIVTYPQYWGFRLTGIAATEVTSLGAHTDLWNPFKRHFSSLIGLLDIGAKIAPARLPNEILGPVLPEIASRTGLKPSTPVYCGMHDSNASLLPHLLGLEAPFSVVSTGTWVIAMSVGGDPIRLEPERDTLINVNAFNEPVRSARFMGGREHDLASGGRFPEPSDDDVSAVLRSGAMLLPAVVPDNGPFSGRSAHWVGPEPPVGSGRRGAAVAFYLAMVTEHCLSLIGHRGPIVVEGSFARNRCYKMMLSAATNAEILVTGSSTGTSLGAALLATDMQVQWPGHRDTTLIVNSLRQDLQPYFETWSARLDQDPVSMI